MIGIPCSVVAIIFIRVNFRQVFIVVWHICVGVAAFLELLCVFWCIVRRSLLPFVKQVLSFFEGIRVFLIIQKLPYQAENAKPEVEFRDCFQYPSVKVSLLMGMISLSAFVKAS